MTGLYDWIVWFNVIFIWFIFSFHQYQHFQQRKHFFSFFNILVDIQVWFKRSIGLSPINPKKPAFSEWLFRCSWYSLTSVESYLRLHDVIIFTINPWNPRITFLQKMFKNAYNSKMMTEAKKVRNYSKLFLCSFCSN